MLLLHLKMTYFHYKNKIHQAEMIGKRMRMIHQNFCLKKKAKNVMIFHTPKQITPRNEIAHFGIKEMFEDEDKEIMSSDMDDLEVKNLLNKEEIKKDNH